MGWRRGRNYSVHKGEGSWEWELFRWSMRFFFFLFYLTFILGKNVPNLVQGQLAPSNSSPMLCSKYMFARVFQLTFYRT